MAAGPRTRVPELRVCGGRPHRSALHACPVLLGRNVRCGPSCPNRELALHEKAGLPCLSRRSAPVPRQQSSPRSLAGAVTGQPARTPPAFRVRIPDGPAPAGSSNILQRIGNAPVQGEAGRGFTPCRALSGPRHRSPSRPRRRLRPRRQACRVWATGCPREAARAADFHEEPYPSQARGRGLHAAHGAAHAPPASREDSDVHWAAAPFTRREFTGPGQRLLKSTSVVSQWFLNTL